MLSRRVKNQIYKMITGFFLLPFGAILLIYNESKAVKGAPIFQGYQSELVYWALRLAGFLFLCFCLYRIFSAIKLFMMKIPLTYNEIRTGIYLSAISVALVISLLCISIIWIYHQPKISFILLGISVVLLILLLIRRGQKKKWEKAQLPSVKPQKARDV